MGIKEQLHSYITGGPEVVNARSIINSFSEANRINKRERQKLSEARKVTRRHFIKLAGTGAAAATAIGAGIYTLGESVITPDNSVDWNVLTPQERINNLELGIYPNQDEFNPYAEIFSATSEYFCSKVDCVYTPEELQERVHLVNFDGLLEEYEKREIKLSELEKEKLKQSGLENTFSDNQAYINIDLLEEAVNNTDKIYYSDETQRELFEKRDLKIMMVRSVLLHTFAHINEATNQLAIDPFVLEPKDGSPLLYFQEMKGFSFIGGYDLEKRDKYFLGSNEAITELCALIVSKDLVGYLSGNSRYREAAFMVKGINDLVGVSDEDFLSIAQGNGTSEELIRRWSKYENSDNPNMYNAILALARIGIYVRDGGDVDQVSNEVFNYLRGNQIPH